MADTDSVYRAMQHILETYDGITSTEIEYNNMSSNRGRDFWKVGRQLTEQKKSSTYLDELAKHSFVSIYPTRKGKRGVKAWREDTTVIDTHDDGVILKDEKGKPLITKFEKLPLSKVYNDIELNYDYNPGLGKCNQSLFITNTDQASFPEIYESTGTDTSIPNGTGANTWVDAVVYEDVSKQWILKIHYDAEPTWVTQGQSLSLYGDSGYYAMFTTHYLTEQVGANWYTYSYMENTYSLLNNATSSAGTLYSNGTSVVKWTTYVGGVSSYSNADTWWTICKNAYDETLVVNKLKYDLPWYYDNADFDEPGGTNNTAFYLLNEILSYCTKQKYLVEYYIPINADNLQLELNDPINFNDVNYTDSTDRLGYIKNIKIIPNVKKPSIKISLILEPYTLEEYNLIIETGSAPDTITESGSQPDTITEGAQ